MYFLCGFFSNIEENNLKVHIIFFTLNMELLFHFKSFVLKYRAKVIVLAAYNTFQWVDIPNKEAKI